MNSYFNYYGTRHQPQLWEISIRRPQLPEVERVPLDTHMSPQEASKREYRDLRCDCVNPSRSSRRDIEMCVNTAHAVIQKFTRDWTKNNKISFQRLVFIQAKHWARDDEMSRHERGFVNQAYTMLYSWYEPVRKQLEHKIKVEKAALLVNHSARWEYYPECRLIDNVDDFGIRIHADDLMVWWNYVMRYGPTRENVLDWRP